MSDCNRNFVAAVDAMPVSSHGRWFRFSLRTLLVAIAAVAALLWWYTKEPEYYLMYGKYDDYLLVSYDDKVLMRKIHYGETPSADDLLLPPPPTADVRWRIRETADGAIVSSRGGFLTLSPNSDPKLGSLGVCLSKTVTQYSFWDTRKGQSPAGPWICFLAHGTVWGLDQLQFPFQKEYPAGIPQRFCQTDGPAGPLIVTDRMLVVGVEGCAFKPQLQYTGGRPRTP